MNGLNTLIMQHLKSKPKIKRIYGVIRKVVENTNDTKFQVSVFDNNNEKYDIILLNKTKEALQEGDAVWIHYWDIVTDGYIAIKIGLSSFGSGSGDVIERPLHCKATIIDSYKFNKKNSLISNTYSYTLEEQSIQESRSPNPFSNLFYIDEESHWYTCSGILAGGGVLQFGSHYGSLQIGAVELYPQPYIYTDLTLPLGNMDIYRVIYDLRSVRYSIRRVDTDIQLIRIDEGQTSVELTINNASYINEFGFYFEVYDEAYHYAFNSGLYAKRFYIVLAEKIDGVWVSRSWKVIDYNVQKRGIVMFQTNSIDISSSKILVTQTSTTV